MAINDPGINNSLPRFLLLGSAVSLFPLFIRERFALIAILYLKAHIPVISKLDFLPNLIRVNLSAQNLFQICNKENPVGRFAMSFVYSCNYHNLHFQG
jgi:hypothetical protein